MTRGISLAKQLMMSSAYLVLNKDAVQLFGLSSAFLLSNFIEADSMFKDEHGWFFQTQETVTKVTTLSRHEQNKSIKQLKELGVLEQENRGMPMKRYFRINYDVLATLLVKFQQTGANPVDKSVTVEETPQSIENGQSAKIQQTNMSNFSNLICQNSATINNIYKENSIDNIIDDSLRSSSFKLETVNESDTESYRENDKEKDFEPLLGNVEIKALEKDSKYKKVGKPSIDISEVISETAEKTKERRKSKKQTVRKTPRNANTIVAYFGEQFKEHFGGVAPLELQKDRKLMKNMIEHYGYDTVTAYIDWMFRNWAQFRRECNIKGVATVGMFYGYRAYFQEQVMYTVEDSKEVPTNVWGV